MAETERLGFSNFFTHYCYEPNSKQLSSDDQTVARWLAGIGGVLTLGLLPIISYFVNGTSVGGIENTSVPRHIVNNTKKAAIGAGLTKVPGVSKELYNKVDAMIKDKDSDVKKLEEITPQQALDLAEHYFSQAQQANKTEFKKLMSEFITMYNIAQAVINNFNGGDKSKHEESLSTLNDKASPFFDRMGD